MQTHKHICAPAAENKYKNTMISDCTALSESIVFLKKEQKERKKLRGLDIGNRRLQTKACKQPNVEKKCVVPLPVTSVNNL